MQRGVLLWCCDVCVDKNTALRAPAIRPGSRHHHHLGQKGSGRHPVPAPLYQLPSTPTPPQVAKHLFKVHYAHLVRIRFKNRVCRLKCPGITPKPLNSIFTQYPLSSITVVNDISVGASSDCESRQQKAPVHTYLEVNKELTVHSGHICYTTAE